jgi:hypothetical protein
VHHQARCGGFASAQIRAKPVLHQQRAWQYLPD